MSATVWSIVVAAGSGTRFGRAKQYERLGDRRVLDWALAAARAVSEGVVLVVPPDSAGRREAGADAVVPGGSTRSESVRAGLAAVPGEADVVVVHDAARPLASVALFEAVVAAVSGEGGADCAIPGVAVANTVKRVRGSAVVETVDRVDLVEVQTPQGFSAAALRAAHADAPDATDDAALVESAGGRVVVVPGEPVNLKLTHPEDLLVLRALIEREPS
ncbi:MAG TPA: 2-C-methyl-D-erythritol 4-phosphate cytidylyltransferase [Acidimicrobiales bacterium]|nr:2-C-methyl-D-erythritol 4-phosphate cytidylyltransferase [Acidimicrobiales bacterium]